MAIHMPGYYQNNIVDMQRQYGTQEVTVQENPEKEIQSEEQIRSLTPGQAINGEVIARDGAEIQLQVGRGIVLTARMDQSIQTPIGHTVTFEVRSNSGGTLALRPLFENLTQETTAGKALLAAGLGNDARSMQMVMSMMHEGMSIDRESLQNMNRQIMNMPEADINSIVQMNRLQIPVTPENLGQFEAYKNYEHQLLSSFEDIFNEIPQAVNDVFNGNGNSQGAAFINQLLQIFDKAGENVSEGNALPSQEGNLPYTGETVFVDGKENPVNSMGKGITENFTAESPVEDISIRDEESIDVGKAAQRLPDGKESNGSQGKVDIIIENEGSEKEAAGVENNRALITEQNTGVETTHEKASARTAFDTDMTKMSEIYGKAGGSPEIANRIAQGNINPEEIYQAVKELGKRANTPEKQAAFRDLFLTKGFQKIFQNKMSDNWLIRPEEVGKEGVAKLYERLNEQTRQLTLSLSNGLKADSPLMKTVSQIQENVDFMNHINQMYTYVQLPLRFKGENAHGDLYVYTNKKNLAKKDGNISAFLHLDMEHLGAVDVRVVMEKNKISTNFYLEDEKSLDLIADNMDILTKRLQEKGYDVTAKATLKEKEENVMDEILATDKNIGILSELAFDVRA